MSLPGILLINPHIEDFSAYDHFSKPLGMIWFASYLKQNFDLHFINALRRDHPKAFQKTKAGGTGDFPKQVIDKPETLKDIPRNFRRYGLNDELFIRELQNTPFRPKYIFVTSGMTYWYTGLQHTIRLIREIYPETPVILGGIYATLLPLHAKKHSGADEVIPGQNIQSLLKDISKLTGISLIDKTFLTPAYDLLGEYNYLPLLTSVGCVFRCDYCAGHRLNNFTQFNPQSCARTIIDTHQRYGVKNFAFYDDALLIHPEKHINPILKEVINSGIKSSFYTPNGLHIRFLTRETAELMNKVGFVDIRLSLESGDPQFHQSEDHKTNMQEFKRAVQFLRQAGFNSNQIQVYTLINIPGQDPGNILPSMRMIRELGATPRIALFSPIPGTPDYHHAERISDVSEPLFQNNTVYLYRSGFDQGLLKEIKDFELDSRIG